MKPYAPNLINIPANITEPATGASTWAKGNQIWNGNIGILTAKLAKKHKNIIKSVARVNKIALTLQKTLDLEKGGEIAKNLDHLYQHIRYAVIRVHDDHDFTFLQSAEKVTASINEGWSKMSLAPA